MNNEPAISETAVWCKDCKYFDIETGICVNADSDWVADFPPEYGSCEYCKRRNDDE